MPKLILTVAGTHESVVRPIILGITRDLMKVTKLDPATQILYPGESNTTSQPGSTITDHRDQNSFSTNAKVTIDVEETVEIDRLLSTAIYRPENLHIFRDDRIETYIKPAYSSTDVVMNFRYRAEDKVAAQRWLDDIRTHVSMARTENIHHLTYHYLIPEEFLVILKEIHRMREAVAPYGEDYDTFFAANASQRVSELTTMSGEFKAWGVSETQMRVLGWFDFDGVPEKGGREDDTDTWTISFSYRFKYDKPIACTMNYPLVIHNQLVKQAFRPAPSDAPDRMEHHKRSYAMSALNFSKFEGGPRFLGNDSQPGLAVPAFDEFIPASVVSDTRRMATMMVNIDTAQPSFMLSLRDLGDYSICDLILDFMIGEAPFMAKPMKSVFLVSLYQNADLMDPTFLRVDADLNVHTNKPLSLRNYHHVRLGLVTDLSLLDAAAILRLRNNGAALIKILKAIDPTLECKGLLPNIIGDNYVTREDFKNASDEINRGIIALGDDQIRQFNTIMTLFIQAYKKDEK